MAPVEVYTTPYCSYCVAAKALLRRKGIEFTEIDVAGNAEMREKMIARANGQMTVPQIFIGEHHVGGSDELRRPRSGRRAEFAAASGLCMTSGKPTFRIGLVQMRSFRSPQVNIDTAVKLIREAKAGGADYVQTPEMTNLMEAGREALFGAIAEEESDLGLATLRELARQLKIWLHIGSFAIKVSHDKAANRAFLINPKGEIVARYDKIHMFDVDLVGEESYREVEQFSRRRPRRHGRSAMGPARPDDLLRSAVSRSSTARWRPLARSFLTVPAAFTRQTGEAHWHVLLRARAIENGCYVLAAAQGGVHENKRETYGHSLVIDPWGKVLAEGGTEPGVIFADVDPALVATVRGRLPSLQHGRRFEVIEPIAEPAHLHAVRGALS